MPVQVVNLITQAGKVDLVGLQMLAHQGLDRENDLHQFGLRGGFEIGHFTTMFLPDHTGETRKGLRTGIIGEHDAPLRALHDQVAAGLLAQRT